MELSPMVHQWTLFLLVGLYISACQSGGTQSAESEMLTGIYVHTYTADVIDPETGETMGIRTVADSIFIKVSGDKYEVSNHKWMLNDYENDGWTTRVPDADKPMTTYVAEFDETSKVLKALADNKPPLFVDDDKIYWGEAKALEYTKVD